MENFDYRKYTKGGLTTQEVDTLLHEVSTAKIPNFPIPIVGASLYIVLLGVKIAAIFRLLSIRKERIDLELLVKKQLHQQDTGGNHDSDVMD